MLVSKAKKVSKKAQTNIVLLNFILIIFTLFRRLV
jgi:hypothetical protein